MRIDDFIGSDMFLGTERMADEIYPYMCTLSLTDLERCVLLHYLALPKSVELRKVFMLADAHAREAARDRVMAKFPKEWPPANSCESRPTRSPEFSRIKVT